MKNVFDKIADVTPIGFLDYVFYPIRTFKRKNEQAKAKLTWGIRNKDNAQPFLLAMDRKNYILGQDIIMEYSKELDDFLRKSNFKIVGDSVLINVLGDDLPVLDAVIFYNFELNICIRRVSSETFKLCEIPALATQYSDFSKLHLSPKEQYAVINCILNSLLLQFNSKSVK
jgi:hypothetical protein